MNFDKVLQISIQYTYIKVVSLHSIEYYTHILYRVLLHMHRFQNFSYLTFLFMYLCIEDILKTRVHLFLAL